MGPSMVATKATGIGGAGPGIAGADGTGVAGAVEYNTVNMNDMLQECVKIARSRDQSPI